MAGDTNNARIWETAEVWIADADTSCPASPTADLTTDFTSLGLLDQDTGLSFGYTDTTSEYYAYGNILVRQATIKVKETFSFGSLENSDTVFGIRRPGSSASESGGITTRELRPLSFGLNIKTVCIVGTDGSNTALRWYPKVQIKPDGEEQWTDSGLTVYKFACTLLAASDGSDGTWYGQELTTEDGAAPTGS